IVQPAYTDSVEMFHYQACEMSRTASSWTVNVVESYVNQRFPQAPRDFILCFRALVTEGGLADPPAVILAD
ncbi:MAG: hypothetical protein QXQ81_09665, partial [Candidatus Thorarchaeota archaeon]